MNRIIKIGERISNGISMNREKGGYSKYPPFLLECQTSN